eukprot:RCo001401
MSSNFLASLGSWFAISSLPTKMDSRYIHFICTTIQTMITSPISASFFSHRWTSLRKGRTHFTLLMLWRFMMLSSIFSLISEVSIKTYPRSMPLRSYFFSENDSARQVSLIAVMAFSMLSSLAAPATMFRISSLYRNSCMSTRFCRVKLAKSKVFPVTSISIFQWRSLKASCLRSLNSGKLSKKFRTPSLIALKGSSSLYLESIFFSRDRKLSVTFVITSVWTSTHSWLDHLVRFSFQSSYTSYTTVRSASPFSSSVRSVKVVISSPNSFSALISTSRFFCRAARSFFQSFTNSRPLSRSIPGFPGPLSAKVCLACCSPAANSRTWSWVTRLNLSFTAPKSSSRRLACSMTLAQKWRRLAASSASSGGTGMAYCRSAL